MCPRSAWRGAQYCPGFSRGPRFARRVLCDSAAAESSIRSLAGLLSQGRRQPARCAPSVRSAVWHGHADVRRRLDPGRPGERASPLVRRAIVAEAGWRVDRTGRWWRTHLRRCPGHRLAGIEAEARRAGSKDAGSAMRMRVISRMRAGARRARLLPAPRATAVIAWRRLC